MVPDSNKQVSLMLMQHGFPDFVMTSIDLLALHHQQFSEENHRFIGKFYIQACDAKEAEINREYDKILEENARKIPQELAEIDPDAYVKIRCRILFNKQQKLLKKEMLELGIKLYPHFFLKDIRGNYTPRRYLFALCVKAAIKTEEIAKSISELTTSRSDFELLDYAAKPKQKRNSHSRFAHRAVKMLRKESDRCKGCNPDDLSEQERMVLFVNALAECVIQLHKLQAVCTEHKQTKIDTIEEGMQRLETMNRAVGHILGLQTTAPSSSDGSTFPTEKFIQECTETRKRLHELREVLHIHELMELPKDISSLSLEEITPAKNSFAATLQSMEAIFTQLQQ